MNLGAVYGSRNQLPEALDWTRKSIEIHQGLVAKEPNNALFRRDLAKAYYNLALLERRAGRPADALASCRRATILYQQLYDEQPQVIEFRRSSRWQCVGDELAQESGKSADSLATFQEFPAFMHGPARRAATRWSSSNIALTWRLLWGQIGRLTADPEQALQAYGQAKGDLVEFLLVRDNPTNPRYPADLSANLARDRPARTATQAYGRGAGGIRTGSQDRSTPLAPQFPSTGTASRTRQSLCQGRGRSWSRDLPDLKAGRTEQSGYLEASEDLPGTGTTKDPKDAQARARPGNNLSERIWPGLDTQHRSRLKRSRPIDRQSTSNVAVERRRRWSAIGAACFRCTGTLPSCIARTNVWAKRWRSGSSGKNSLRATPPP